MALVHSICDTVQDDRLYYREQIQLAERCKDFLWKQEHYANDPGVTLDDARIAPKGAELNDLHRYKVAQICADGPYVECHPRDHQGDPRAAEYAKRVLMSIVEDATNRYDAFRQRIISGALGVGTWYGMVHWNPDRGPMGDVSFETLGPDQVFPCSGYLDVHDPMCPHVTIERHETVAALKAKGYDVEGLWPDCRGRYGSETDWQKASGHPSPDDEYLRPTVTVLYHFTRAAYDTEAADGGYRDLESDSQYMACPKCGYKELNHDRMPDGSLPEAGSTCPRCLEDVMAGEAESPSYLYRVTRERITEHRLKYPNGKLCIVAEKSRRLLSEGPWPAPARSFPLWQQRAYESPYEQMGGCDTLIYWSLQALMDQLRKQAYDQMVLSKPVTIMAEAMDGGPSLVDASGKPWLYDDTQGQMAYARNIMPGSSISNQITQFQGSGMPTSLPTLYSILSQSFYQSRGVGQVAFGPDQSKDVAYRSLLLQKESGDVPVDDHKRIMRREEGMFLGIVLDYWVHNSTSERAIRYLGPDGQMGFQLLKGSDIPNVDVIVGTPPTVKQGALDEISALLQWSQIPVPSVRRIVARRLGLSPSEVAEVEAELSQPQQPQGDPMGGMMNGTPMPEFSAAPGGAFPPMQ